MLVQDDDALCQVMISHIMMLMVRDDDAGDATR